MKEILEKKKKDDTERKREEKKFDEVKNAEEDEEHRKLREEEKDFDEEENAEQNLIKKMEEIKEKKKKQLEEQKKKEYELIGKNLITEKDKEIFKNGLDYPEANKKLMAILQRNYKGEKPQLPIQEQYKIQICTFGFEDISNIPFPRPKFEYNKMKLDKLGINIDERIEEEASANKEEESNEEDENQREEGNSEDQKDSDEEKSVSNSPFQPEQNEMLEDKIVDKEESNDDNFIQNVQIHSKSETSSRYRRNFFHFKIRPFLEFKYVSYLDEFFEPKEENPESQANITEILRSIEPYRVEKEFQSLENKIAIQASNNQNEIFVFDPINSNPSTGVLESILFEVQLKKRARLLVPSREEFIKAVIQKLLKFLLIIKSINETTKKPGLTESTFNERQAKNKTKLSEIKGTKICTFSEVSTFMQSRFGNFNMKKFSEIYHNKIKQNEENKKQKRLEELKRKMKEALSQKEEKDYESDDVDEIELDKKQFSRRKDAIPIELMNDAKMLYGATYKPRKKMNYLNGLKMLIKEEVSKKQQK